MELRELRSFTTAARLSSITRAAEELGMGQPTVTTHIKKLERELGTVLFDRIKRPIQLTPAGATLTELATPLLEGIDSLAADSGVAELERPVRLASTHDMIPHTLLRVVRVFIAAHPHSPRADPLGAQGGGGAHGRGGSGGHGPCARARAQPGVRLPAAVRVRAGADHPDGAPPAAGAADHPWTTSPGGR